MTGRLIAIGDVHGCHLELAELISRLELGREDRLVLLGDLVNRGPDSCKVLDLARANKAIALLGNHGELRLLKYRRTNDRKYVKEHDLDTFEKLRPQDWAYLEAMPLTYEAPGTQHGFPVHGGFLPNEPWQKQPPEVVSPASRSSIMTAARLGARLAPGRPALGRPSGTGPSS